MKDRLRMRSGCTNVQTEIETSDSPWPVAVFGQRFRGRSLPRRRAMPETVARSRNSGRYRRESTRRNGTRAPRTLRVDGYRRVVPVLGCRKAGHTLFEPIVAETIELDPSHLRRGSARRRCRTARLAGMVSVFLRRGPCARIQSRSGRFATPTHVIDDLSSLPCVLLGNWALYDLRVIVSTLGASRLRAGIVYRRAAHVAAQGKPLSRRSPHKPGRLDRTLPPTRHTVCSPIPKPPNENPPKPPPSRPSPPNPPIPWPILSPHGPDMTIRIACPRITMPHVDARA